MLVLKTSTFIIWVENIKWYKCFKFPHGCTSYYRDSKNLTHGPVCICTQAKVYNTSWIFKRIEGCMFNCSRYFSFAGKRRYIKHQGLHWGPALEPEQHSQVQTKPHHRSRFCPCVICKAFSRGYKDACLIVLGILKC